jgi:hypothetical protein
MMEKVQQALSTHMLMVRHTEMISIICVHVLHIVQGTHKTDEHVWASQMCVVTFDAKKIENFIIFKQFI